jgi:1-acyl-sn-glycerol-3-phosphate acyltransferase
MFSVFSVFSVASVVVVFLFLAAGWLLLLRGLERASGADWGNRWLNRLDGLNRLFCRHVHGLKSAPLQLPDHGPALLAANHVSGLDPLLLIAASRRPLRFIIASEQYHRFGLEWLFRAVRCIPVDRSGRPERAFREALKALRAGEVVALFPHGTLHLDTDPRRPLKAGVARLARLAGVPVHAACIEGVRGQGLVVASVVLPSRARISGFAPIPCQNLSTHECLTRLQSLIEPARPA